MHSIGDVLADHRDVIPYALQQGLISADAVSRSDVLLADMSRRNRNFQIRSEHAGSYFLKQGMGREGETSVRREAEIYNLFGSRASFGPLKKYLPEFLGYDVGAGVLVLRLIDDAIDLRRYHIDTGVFSVTPAKALGTALGLLHSDAAVKDDGTLSASLNAEPPWVLAAHRLGFEEFVDSSPAHLQVSKIVQYTPELGLHLDRLRDEWRAESIIHNDLKWDNCLVYSRAGSKRRTRLALIDWEVASLGDPAWDIGSVFCDYLSFWVLSMPIASDAPLDQLPSNARYSLNSMHRALAAFWTTYVRTMSHDRNTENAELLRATRYAGARLIQTAFELVRMASDLSGNVVAIVQLAQNLLTRPQNAATHLLRLKPRRELSDG